MKIKTLKCKIFNKKAGASVGKAIKILTSVVLGAAMLAGTYGVVKTNVIPTAYSKIESLYEADGFAPAWGFGEATGDPIPFGGTYTKKSTGEIMQGTTANTFPKPATGDTYEFGDYIYTYNKGGDYGTKWSVAINTKVTDKNRSSYGEILSEVASEPVTNLYQTFKGCSSLVVSPKIPDTITIMFGIFYGCSSLVEAPELSNTKISDMTEVFRGCSSMKTYDGSIDPDGDFSNYVIPYGVRKLRNTFNGCKSMVKAPEIPDTVTGEWGMVGTFYYCTSLTTAPAIPNSVTSMSYTFAGCSSLVEAPSKLPSGLTNMYRTFYCCSSLTTAPTIPNSVTSMEETFNGCTSLIKAPEVPSGVTSLFYTFYNCYSLVEAPNLSNNHKITNMDSAFSVCKSLKTYTGSIDPDGDFSNYIIPNSVTNMSNTFNGCSSLVQAPSKLPSGLRDMVNTFTCCTSLIKAPEIPNNVTTLKYAFSGCESLIEGPSKIPKSVGDMTFAFSGCESLKIAPVLEGAKNLHSSFQGCTSMTTFPSAIPAGSGPLWNTFEWCSSLTGTIEINATAPYGNCFNGTVKPIVLTGTASNLSDLAATSSRGNVTVAQ